MEQPDRSEVQQNKTNRRSFMKAVSATGLVAIGGAGVVIAQSGNQGADFELGGQISGWVGQAPSSIEGNTNPTLSLQAGETYQLTWENLDGVGHNFIIENNEGNELVGTEIMNEQGETLTLEFTATTEMAEYYCSPHPSTMRGSIEVQEGTPEPPTEEPTE